MTNNIKNPNNLNNKFYPNLRDLGGYKTKENLMIKNELIYRSNELIFENEAATAQIAALNLKNIYDFRTANERTKSPDITLNNVSNNWLNIFRDDASNVAALGESSIFKSKSLIEKVWT